MKTYPYIQGTTLKEWSVPKRKPATADSNDIETFGARLARLRADAGLSQRDLAAQLGISQRMIAYYESETDHAPAQLLPELADLLGVSVDELLGRKPAKSARGPSNQRLWRRFRLIEKLPPKERKQLLGVIDAVLDRHRLTKSDTAA